MNRLVKCIKLQLKSMALSTLVFTAIYYGVCMLLLAGITIRINGLSVKGSYSSGFYIGSAIFAMVFVMSNYKSNFNYLMIFGNSRKNIFFSSAVTSFAFSAVLALISVVTQWLEAVISQYFGFKSSIGLLDLIYENTNMASEFLYYFMLFALITSFSMLYGSLAYKLGKAFVSVFWVVFGFSFIFLTVSTGLNSPLSRFILNVMTAFFQIGKTNGILLAPANFAVTALLLAAITFLLSYRQPQNA